MAERIRRRRGAAVAGLAALIGLAVAALAQLPAAGLVDARLYDLISTAHPPMPPADVVVVAIDEPSFANVGEQWPWSRSIHGALVRALREAGARAIGLDLIFAEPSAPEADAALGQALGPDVVLAADETLIETPQASQVIRSEPLPILTEGGAASGLASVVLDGDGVLRRLPPFDDSFARRILAAAGEPARPSRSGDLLAAFGPARTIQTVSYYQALEPETYLPPDFFKGKIVLAGLSLQSAPTVDAGGADAFATSFTTTTGRLVAGVEVQATVLENVRRGLYARPLPTLAGFGVVVLAALAAGLAVIGGTGAPTVLIGVAGTLVLAGGSALLLHGTNLWISPAAPSLAFLAVLAAQGGFDYAAERRLRRTITRAFSQYLAPEMVDSLARDPSALKLGGERRTLTILFCDVRGFTTISERLKDDPERLTSLINRLLDPLSDAVLKRGGTIDKYIGDCVMAFWNAPLDDPDHAVHAVETALAMVAAARRFDAALHAEPQPGGTPLPSIAVGVGINTGDVVVGNMGSTARFDYTVLGDAVNLASRLEGLCKTYGVPIVIGDSTRTALGDRFATLPLDRIAVRGRSEAARVHTVLEDAAGLTAETAALHEAVVEAFAAGELAADDARIARLEQAVPTLAGFYASLRTRAGAT
ncbi:CHASE2 domain-containing protein [Chthonobacter albigriseus]|uniref:CHASE2 domain-containing protein n=1 Tax=Chthonobacter albigriseus TaxID=1683161 RepID=UPI0015EEB29E|nr:adenylate/guanylate cyclase domain-containing protein [Chthonobacter albigriseus]